MVEARVSAARTATPLIVVLYVQAATAACVAVASIFGASGFAHTIVDGRRLGVGFLAFAVMLVAVVIPRIRDDRRLFIVPLAWTVLHLADSLFELLGLGDAAFVPPVIVEAVFLIAYALTYWLLANGGPGSYRSG